MSFFVIVFSASWVPCWCLFGSPNGAKLGPKWSKTIVRKVMIFKSGQERPKGAFGRVLGGSWGRLGGILGALGRPKSTQNDDFDGNIRVKHFIFEK